MSLRMEVKQHTPSVIARLIGLDEQPLQQTPNRIQKVLSEEYHRKTSFIGVLGKRSYYVDRLNRSTARKQEKDYNIGEVLSTDSISIWSICDGKGNPKAARIELGFSGARRMCSKSVSEDEMLRHSKRVAGVMKDQHAQDRQRYHQPYFPANNVADPNALESHMESDCLSAPRGDVCKKLKFAADRTSLRSLKFENHLRQPAIDHLNKPLKEPLELRDKSCHLFARSIVQKPNSSQAHRSRELLLSTTHGHYQSDVQMYAYHRRSLLNPEIGIVNVKEPGTASAKNELPRYCLRDTSEVARKTHQTEEQYVVTQSRGLSRSKITVEQSSMNFSKYLMKSSHSPFDCTNRHQISHHFPYSSIFDIEAKKKIVEQRKTKYLQEGKVTGQRCRLGEKFEMHDLAERTKKLYPKLENHCFSRPEGTNTKLVDNPLRIGMKDGLKDKHLGSLLMPNPIVIAAGSPNLQTRSDDAVEGSSLVLDQTETETHYKLRIAFSMREDNLEEGSRSATSEKPHDQSAYLHCSDNCQTNAFCDLCSCSSEADDRSTISEVLIRNFALINGRAHEKIAASYKDELSGIAPGTFLEKDGSCDVHGDLTLKMSPCQSKREECFSRQQYDPDLAVNLGDANQPTPNSVLEPPFKKEDSPVADFRGLEMKLQLLNSKFKETNSGCSVMAVSSDEDVEMDSGDLPRNSERMSEMIKPEESRDFSYLVDVLDQADISDGNLDRWYHRLHAKELAMSFSVFEVLEKKYGKQTSWQKSERRFMFDCINSGLTEILFSFLDFNMAAKPLRRRLSSGLRRTEIEDQLWKSLLIQEKEVSKDLGEKALAKDIKWLELEGDVIFICTEIEQFLFDELAAELGSNECL